MTDRRELMLSKLRAFAVHLCGSVAIISLYLLLVFLVWYPYPYFAIEKVWDVIRVVIGVDIFIGPLLTLVVYRAGKPSLKFDLTAIIAVQLAALIWGATVTFTQRPAYTALVSDNAVFKVVSASEVDTRALADPALNISPWSGPRMVYVDLPYDQEEYVRLGKENLKNGREFAQYTQFYEPILNRKDEVLKQAIDMRQRMTLFPELRKMVAAVLDRHGGTLDDYIFVSVEGRVSLGFLMLRRDDLQVVDALLE
jgi:hypothetical protein